MPIYEQPVAKMSDVIDSFRAIEAGYILLVVQIDRDEFVADLGQQLSIVDDAELVDFDELLVGINACLDVLLFEGDPGLAAIGLRLLEPSKLVEAVAIEEDKFDHDPVERLIDHSREVPEVLGKYVIAVEHHAPLLTHLDHLGGLLTEFLMQLSIDRSAAIILPFRRARCYSMLELHDALKHGMILSYTLILAVGTEYLTSYLLKIS